MSTNQTPNYSLSQWEKTDKVLMEDFNADNAKIDAALKAEADARTSLAGQLAGKGSCSVEVTTYVGNGQHGQESPTTVAFRKRPVAFLIASAGWLSYSGSAGGLIVGSGSASNALAIATGYTGGTAAFQYIPLTWNGARLSYYSTSNETLQMNISNFLYIVIAFYSES